MFPILFCLFSFRLTVEKYGIQIDASRQDRPTFTKEADLRRLQQLLYSLIYSTSDNPVTIYISTCHSDEIISVMPPGQCNLSAAACRTYSSMSSVSKLIVILVKVDLREITHFL